MEIKDATKDSKRLKRFKGSIFGDMLAPNGRFELKRTLSWLLFWFILIYSFGHAFHFTDYKPDLPLILSLIGWHTSLIGINVLDKANSRKNSSIDEDIKAP